MNLSKASIASADVEGKRVLVRVDFNVPQDKSGAITNNQRIVGAIPTIELALKKGAKWIVELWLPFIILDFVLGLVASVTSEAFITFLQETWDSLTALLDSEPPSLLGLTASTWLSMVGYFVGAAFLVELMPAWTPACLRKGSK